MHLRVSNGSLVKPSEWERILPVESSHEGLKDARAIEVPRHDMLLELVLAFDHESAPVGQPLHRVVAPFCLAAQHVHKLLRKRLVNIAMQGRWLRPRVLYCVIVSVLGFGRLWLAFVARGVVAGAGLSRRLAIAGLHRSLLVGNAFAIDVSRFDVDVAVDVAVEVFAHAGLPIAQERHLFQSLVLCHMNDHSSTTW